MQTCKVDICERSEIEGRGYCKAHYAWARRRDFNEKPTHKIGDGHLQEQSVSLENMSGREVGWIAGLIDGEGYFRSDHCRVGVGMTDKESIEALNSMLPGSTRIQERGDGRKTMYRWEVAAQKDVVAILSEIIDLLTVPKKVQRANEILEEYGENA